MIYAMKCESWIKFGRSCNSVHARLREIRVANPHEVELIAQADWPDEEEELIHVHLTQQHHRGEWFNDGEEAREVIRLMLDQEGLSKWRALTAEKRKIKKPAQDFPRAHAGDSSLADALGDISTELMRCLIRAEHAAQQQFLETLKNQSALSADSYVITQESSAIH